MRVKNDNNIPFILVGNKADLTNNRKVQQATANNRAAQWQVSGSALLGLGTVIDDHFIAGTLCGDISQDQGEC